MNGPDVALWRLRNQRLIGEPFARPQDAVAALGAVQSQDYAGASWALGQRADACTGADVHRAYSEGAILRTHIMRPTWHFVAPADIRWIQELTGPRVQAGNAGRYRQLELDAATLRASQRIIERALRAGTRLTRTELAHVLNAKGIDATGQRLAYMVMNAELNLVACSGGRRDGQHTYALVDGRAPAAPALSRDEALGRLALRYFTGHGPAQPQDFAWWSGLTVADARRGIEANAGDLESLDVDGKRHWFAAGSRPPPIPRRPIVHLLPNYDESFIAYRDRSAMMHPEVTRDGVVLNDVLGVHVITLNGQIVGGWRRYAKDGAAINATLLVEFDRAEHRALERAAAAFARFAGGSAALEISYRT